MITNQQTITKLRPNTDLDIVENPMEWLRTYQQGFLAHYEQTGVLDWNRYERPRNLLAPSGTPAVGRSR